MPGGLIATGSSNSVTPWPNGGTTQPLVVKRPWEGIMRFHPDSSLSARFVRPRVFNTAGHPSFMSGGETSAPISVTPVAIDGISSGAPPLAPVTVAEPVFIPLERQDIDAIRNFGQWASYHQVPADANADTDGDGIINGLESYFGLDPWAFGTLPPLTMKMETIGAQVLPVLEFPRAVYAETLGFGVETSTGLDAWDPLPADFTIDTQPAGNGYENVWIYHSIPEPRRFYRVRAVPTP